MKRKTLITYIILYFLTFISTIFVSKLYFENQSKKVYENYIKIAKEEISKEKIKLENNKSTKNEETINNDLNKTYNIKLSFTGNIMLASYKDQTTPGSFNEYANNKESSYFLSKVNNIFKEDDFTIVNLENVLTDQPLTEINKNTEPAYWYKSKTDNINILTSSSVEGVSISNNHSNDYGPLGKQDTINTISKTNMQYGDYNNIMYFKKNNYVIAVICKGLWIESQANEIITLIKEAEKKSDYQIVFFHGGQERIHKPEEWKINATRKLIDNGADLVIGSHPHVLQPREIYKDKEIIYSLGNFCYGGSKNPENRTIIYQINLTIDNNNSLINKESNIIPCYVYTGKSNNYQPAPIEDESIKNKVLNFMDWKEESPL